MNASLLVDTCLAHGIDFYTGVPDSLLKSFCEELYRRWGTAGPTHMVAQNEGGAIGLCAGHFLATGRPACCYMQNSGLGNAVNPLASLMDVKVYALPCLLVIGWRGEPGVKDEPQHVRQGEITLGQLDLMEIPYLVLSPETSETDFLTGFQRLMDAMAVGRCAAIVVRKGAFAPASVSLPENGFTLSRESAAEIVISLSGEDDIFVSTTGKLSREIYEIRERAGQDHRRDFLTVGSMGHASMIALRLAQELPSRRVWCLDGDGAALMHLGALPVIGQASPKNFFHVLFNNQCHETVGGMPVCNGALDGPELARAAGYRAVCSAEDEVTLERALGRLRETAGPALLEIRCARGARADLGRPATTPRENRDAFMSFLQ